MNILVTGAGGYIGKTLVPKKIADGHCVTAVDDFFSGRSYLLSTLRLGL